MGRENRKPILPAGANGTKERHKRVHKAQFDPMAPVPEGLVAKPSVPKSKHHTYFEFVENKEKKKKLEVQVTRAKTPPPGFEFVPIGNPVLTSACKELSRERDAMIFIVSSVATNSLSQQVNRLGHHVRQTIVEAARESISHLPQSGPATPDGKPEPIPESQAEYHLQADAALRDLFPRIPNTDRQIIIEHAFTRRTNGKGDQPVGFSDDIPLARRVQLAVLAHIRHAHTRYDELLKEAGWQKARRAVEELCLDIIVKWRGDEETGRDQLDEILREVVIISDSEDDGSDAYSTDDPSVDSGSTTSVIVVSEQSVPSRPAAAMGRVSPPGVTAGPSHMSVHTRGKNSMESGDRGPNPNRKDQRGFKRYRAWQDALVRNREPGVQGPDFTSGDNGEYDPLHPQIHLEPREDGQHGPPSHNGGRPTRAAGFQVSTSTRTRCSPSYPRRADTPPPVALYTAVSQSSGNALNLSAHDGPADGLLSSSRMMPPPVTHRLRDSLFPSIEPTSSQTMQPAFIRSVPPRKLDPVDHVLHSRAPELFHRYSSIQSMESFREDMAGRPGDRRIICGQPAQRLQPNHFVNEGPFYVAPVRADGPSFRDRAGCASPPWQYSGRLYEQPDLDAPRADRIVVNASRPGTLSNPILMEDRGGFYERIPLAPPEPRRVMQGDDGGSSMYIPPQEAFTAPPSHRALASGERERSMVAGQDQPGRPYNEATSLLRSYPVPYSERFRHQPPAYSRQPIPFNPPPIGPDAAAQQWLGQHPGHRWSNQQDRNQSQAEEMLYHGQNSHRLHGSKRPADDDHYQSHVRIRRPRTGQPENVIVLD